MNTSRPEKAVKELFIGKCWQYLHDNFHKFNEPNKIKIALALATKDMPQEVNGMNLKQIVMMGEIKKGADPIRFNIGEPDEQPAPNPA